MEVEVRERKGQYEILRGEGDLVLAELEGQVALREGVDVGAIKPREAVARFFDESLEVFETLVEVEGGRCSRYTRLGSLPLRQLSGSMNTASKIESFEIVFEIVVRKL